LNLLGTDTKGLPLSIVAIRQLMCLTLNWGIRLPHGLRNLTSLEALCCATVDSAHIVEELGHLAQLRILDFRLKLDKEAGYDNEGICKALVESLGKLQRIRHLAVGNFFSKGGKKLLLDFY
jgi:disease resistance protein RPM1